MSVPLSTREPDHVFILLLILKRLYYIIYIIHYIILSFFLRGHISGILIFVFKKVTSLNSIFSLYSKNESRYGSMKDCFIHTSGKKILRCNESLLQNSVVISYCSFHTFATLLEEKVSASPLKTINLIMFLSKKILQSTKQHCAASKG